NKNIFSRILFNINETLIGADKILLSTIGLIVSFGLIMLSSATSAVAYTRYGDTYYFFKHQVFGLILGLVAFFILAKIDYHRWDKYGFYFLIVSIFLLLLVFIPGLSAHYGKSQSWINVFGFSLQPSELVKISFLIYLSSWLAKRNKEVRDLGQGTAPFLFVLGLVSFLMLKQPDFGTLSIIAAVSVIVYFVGGANIKHLAIIVALGLVGLAGMINLSSYQADRIKCFVDPSSSSGDACYQVSQSLIAVGSGGFFGRGLGASRQKFAYLPEVSGDSIFPIIGEEVGWLFSSGLIGLYLLLFYRGFIIAKRAPDPFGKLLAIGIVSWVVVQAIVNIGGMINFMPMTGVPLPFISYGGSAIMSVMAAMGILVNISKYRKFKG
ncbi:MAG: putative lipid II flippase FtsW, partial [Candidatus Falkowbacteria bacterium]|nr:putative lipid II flippase FtsW [Candidatus Falkowbacteria bacterium]